MGPAGQAVLLLCAVGGVASTAFARDERRSTAAENNDVREAALRSLIPADRHRNVSGDSPVYCLAFGTDADPAGEDPPPAFMKRFRDLEDVYPRSWCVRHRTGHRLSAGPVRIRTDVMRRYTPVRVARLWTVLQWFRGGGLGKMVEATQETWGWEVSPSPVYEGPGKPPPVPDADVTEDRRRLAGLAAAYADAWNRRDLEAMNALHGVRASAGSWLDEDRRRLTEPILDTRLDTTPESIDFPKNIRPWAKLHIKLRGTWTQASGTLIPLDPWKHQGAVTTVDVGCLKDTSWWEPGEWFIGYVTAPWDDVRMIK